MDEKYVIPLANMVRLGWYLSPLGIVLGVAGFALWWWRGLNRAAWLFLVLGLLGTLFFVRDTYGTSDQTYIYILRRFVPVAYPTFSLGIAYALVALAARPRSAVSVLRLALSGGMALLLVTFFVWTGRPIYQHIEYRGALEQVGELAARFQPDDVLLLRGGGPTYHQARDVPDLIATPLRFTYGRNAFTVKSGEPGRYADALAQQVRRWRAEGREVYLLLSTSGGDFTLPGFALQRVGDFLLDVPEFEQLTDQKPHNVARLRLPFTVYRLDDQPAAAPGHIATPARPLGVSDFAAQVRGFYLPEANEQGAAYAWTDGDALLRIPWPTTPTLTIAAAGGERPAHLGPARLCLSVLPEAAPWPATPGEYTPLECFTLSDTLDSYRVTLPPELPAAPTGSALLRLESEPWVPAEEDAARHDIRPVGVQFGGLQ
jgi:hypothetical protein